MSTIVQTVCRPNPKGYAVLIIVSLIGAFCFVGAGADELKTSMQHRVDTRMAAIDEMAR